jgi:type II secretory pathway component PulF
VSHYRFEALDRFGRTVRGRRRGESSGQVRLELEREGITPLSIRASRLPTFAASPSLAEAEAGRLACDLARYLRSGLAVTQALALLEETTNARTARFVALVRERIVSGEPLSVALERVAGSSGRLLPTLAAAGEASGRLSDILDIGGKAMLASSALRRRLVTLSLYPAFVLAVALAAIALYAFAVLPALEPALGDLTGELPTSTRLVIIGGKVLRQALPIMGLASVALGGVLLVSSKARDLVREAIGGLLMSPLAGSVMKDIVFSGLASRMAISLQAGVPLPNAYRTSVDAVALTSVRQRLDGLNDKLRDGDPLSVTLQATGLAPTDLVRLVQVGERSDDLGRMLEEAGQALATRAQEKAERLLAAATPLIVVLIGGLVGAVTLLVFQGLMAVTDAVDI